MEKQQEITERELTYGEKSVGIKFNMATGETASQIDEAKTHCAVLINQMNNLRSNSQSPEQKRLCSVAITELQGAQMWAVKAITWKD